MELLVVRHAIAEDRDAFAATGRNDDERPLTEEGARRMAAGAGGLLRVVPELDVIASSPLVRAVQTADILAKAYGHEDVERVPALAPGGDFDAVVDWLERHDPATAVAVVGHEPDLSELVSYLLVHASAPIFSFKKGAACLLEFEGKIGPGEADLRWLLAPKHLRALGGDDA